MNEKQQTKNLVLEFSYNEPIIGDTDFRIQNQWEHMVSFLQMVHWD